MSIRGSFQTVPYIWKGIGALLFIVVALLFFNYLIIYSNLILNIIGGLVAATVSIFVIDLVVEQRREYRKKEILPIAYGRIHSELMTFLEVFLKMWKAAVNKKPSDLPTTFREFVRGDYFKAYGNLNMRTNAPIMPSRPWSIYFNEELERFARGIDSVLHCYLDYLDADFVRQVEDVSRHYYMERGRQLIAMDIVERQGKTTEHYVGQMIHGADDFFSKIGSVIDYVEKNSKFTFGIREDLYNEKTAPLWGDGYVEAQYPSWAPPQKP